MSIFATLMKFNTSGEIFTEQISNFCFIFFGGEGGVLTEHAVGFQTDKAKLRRDDWDVRG